MGWSGVGDLGFGEGVWFTVGAFGAETPNTPRPIIPTRGGILQLVAGLDHGVRQAAGKIDPQTLFYIL